MEKRRLSLIFAVIAVYHPSSGSPFEEITWWCNDEDNGEDQCLSLQHEPRSWSDAKHACEKGGHHLMTVSSFKVWKGLERELAMIGPDTYWIGGNLLYTDWTWSQGRTYNSLQGCYLEDVNDPDLDFFINNVSVSTEDFRKRDSCWNECNKLHYNYTGHILPKRKAFMKRTQDRSQPIRCHCGGSYGRHGRVTDCRVRSDGTVISNLSTDIEMIFRNAGGKTEVIDGEWGEDLTSRGDCAYIHLEAGVKLASAKCSDLRPYICEYEINASTCQSQGGIYVQRCLKLFTTALNWFWAHAECAKNGGILLIFRPEQDLLQYGFFKGQYPLSPWVGLSRWKITWHNPDFNRVGFLIWNAIPDSTSGAGSGCMAVKWDHGQEPSIQSLDCNTEHRFICVVGSSKKPSALAQTGTDDEEVNKAPTTDAPSGTSNLIIGIVASIIGSILLTVIINLICYCVRRSRRNRSIGQSTPQTTSQTAPRAETNLSTRDNSFQEGRGLSRNPGSSYIQPLPSENGEYTEIYPTVDEYHHYQHLTNINRH